CTDSLCFGLARDGPVVNPVFVDDDIRTAKDINRNPPLLLETLCHRSIHDEADGNDVGDGYLSRIRAPQNSRRQISRFRADLIEISTVIEERPAVRLTRRDAEYRNARPASDGND